MWAMLSTPLILGNDLRKMPAFVLSIISNYEVVAVNQDPLVKQATLIADVKKNVFESICFASHCVHTQVWAKKLSGNRLAVVLFNRGGPISEHSISYTPETIVISWKELHLAPGQRVLVRDLWQHRDLGVFADEFISPKPIEQHAVQMLLFTLQ